MMSAVRCPTCNKLFDSEQTPAMPFCSQRCQQVDLHHWLTEQYGLPWEGDRAPQRGEEPPLQEGS
jgi:endogenous inhibitor of DNA gyrase (YacG/DUF329 family)